MDHNLDERYMEVQAWLEEKFVGMPVPQFEVNSANVNKLYDMMQTNRQQDNHHRSLIADAKQKAAEYAAESEVIKSKLQTIGVTSGSLSKSGVQSLQTLCSLALVLDTYDASQPQLLCAAGQHKMHLFNMQEQLAALQQENKKLRPKVLSAMKRREDAQNLIASVEQSEKESESARHKMVTDAKFLYDKCKEYKTMEAKLTKQLERNCNVDGRQLVTHEEILKLSEVYNEDVGALQPLQAKLNCYHDLPPDVTLAKVKVEEVRLKLEKLQGRLDDEIGSQLKPH